MESGSRITKWGFISVTDWSVATAIGHRLRHYIHVQGLRIVQTALELIKDGKYSQRAGCDHKTVTEELRRSSQTV